MSPVSRGNSRHFRIVVTGGGTGGHLFPALAIAEGLLEALPGCEILFLSTGRGIDRVQLAQRRFATAEVPGQGYKGRSLAAKCRVVLNLPRILWRCLVVLRRFDPDLVIGVGGYVTGPVVLAARLLGCKTCIHEQNRIPGMTNRLLGKIVDRICLSLPVTDGLFPAGKTVVTGNPVRQEVLAAADSGMGGAKGPLTLLVIGGSQGAHRVNELVVAALEKLAPRLPKTFTVLHQTGAADADWVAKRYRTMGIQAEVSAFFTDMATVYSRAHCVVSRAGATALAELTALGKAALLIPFPHAADDHQTANGRLLADADAAILAREAESTGDSVAAQLQRLLFEPVFRDQLASNAQRLGRPDAVCRVVAVCRQLLEPLRPSVKVAGPRRKRSRRQDANGGGENHECPMHATVEKRGLNHV